MGLQASFRSNFDLGWEGGKIPSLLFFLATNKGETSAKFTFFQG